MIYLVIVSGWFGFERENWKDNVRLLLCGVWEYLEKYWKMVGRLQDLDPSSGPQFFGVEKDFLRALKHFLVARPPSTPADSGLRR